MPNGDSLIPSDNTETQDIVPSKTAVFAIQPLPDRKTLHFAEVALKKKGSCAGWRKKHGASRRATGQIGFSGRYGRFLEGFAVPIREVPQWRSSPT
jgi:hypothetical protein